MRALKFSPKIRSKMTWQDRACFAKVPVSPEIANGREAARKTASQNAKNSENVPSTAV